LRHHPLVVAPLVGATKPSHLDDLAASTDTGPDVAAGLELVGPVIITSVAVFVFTRPADWCANSAAGNTWLRVRLRTPASGPRRV
jgi:hypothetical protein